MSETTIRPPVHLDYSLTGENATRAFERGLAEADWYQCPVPREAMRRLLERRDGPAIRDTILWFALILGFAAATIALWGELVGGFALSLLCRPLRLHLRLCAECGPSVMAGEQGLEFADNLLGGSFRDQVTFDLDLKALLEERGSLFAGHAQDGGIIGRAPVGIREPYAYDPAAGFGFDG
jgi:hypothetical protein